MGDSSRLDAIAFEPFSEIMLRCGNVELKALAGCNRALRDHVAKFMASPALVADLLVAMHGEHRAIQRIYFDSVYRRFSKNMRSGAACQVVRAGKSPELMSILGGHSSATAQLRYGLLRDALLCHDLAGAQYLYLVRVGPFALSPLLDDGVVLAAICYGPEAFCIGTLLPRCRSELLFRKATDEALSVALRRGRVAVVSYVIERCSGESESADRSEWRIKHARAVARAGGTVDEFRSALQDADYDEESVLREIVHADEPAPIPILQYLVSEMGEMGEMGEEMRPGLQFGLQFVEAVNTAIYHGHVAVVTYLLEVPLLMPLVPPAYVRLDMKLDVVDRGGAWMTILRAAVAFERRCVLHQHHALNDTEISESDAVREAILQPDLYHVKLLNPEYPLNLLLNSDCSSPFTVDLLKILGRSPGAVVMLALEFPIRLQNWLFTAFAMDCADIFEACFGSELRVLCKKAMDAERVGLAWRVDPPVAVLAVLERNGCGGPPAV